LHCVPGSSCGAVSCVAAVVRAKAFGWLRRNFPERIVGREALVGRLISAASAEGVLRFRRVCCVERVSVRLPLEASCKPAAWFPPVLPCVSEHGVLLHSESFGIRQLLYESALVGGSVSVRHGSRLCFLPSDFLCLCCQAASRR
jgi:hypothetical protein